MTLRMQKKNIFFIFFSYDLPAGTLSSVYYTKDKFCIKILFCKHYFSPLNSQHLYAKREGSRSGSPTLFVGTVHILFFIYPQVLSDASKELLNRGPVQIDLDEGQKEAFLR
jgi:hypothetical protein